jgi:GntR family phosphonate transport system transcriptional regulator
MSLYLVQRHGPEALYAQIARHLEREVVTVCKAGDALPPEHELAERFGVNRHTLRRAVEELISKGILERRHGKGVFVIDGYLDYQLGAATRFTETLSALGKSTDSRVIRKLTAPAAERVAERLGLARNEPVVWIETLRFADQRPLCVISHFLPAERFPAVQTDYDGGSLHRFLEAHYGCVLRRTESLVTAVLPQGDDATLLAMPPNRPVLRVKSVNVDERDGRPVEYAVTRFRADRVQLRINP